MTFGTGRDGRTNRQTDKQTDIGTDRLFSENIILDYRTRVNKDRFILEAALECRPQR